jgi:hypothetical protein
MAARFSIPLLEPYDDVLVTRIFVRPFVFKGQLKSEGQRQAKVGIYLALGPHLIFTLSLSLSLSLSHIDHHTPVYLSVCCQPIISFSFDRRCTPMRDISALFSCFQKSTSTGLCMGECIAQLLFVRSIGSG